MGLWNLECTKLATKAPLILDVFSFTVHQGAAPRFVSAHLHTSVMFLPLVSKGEDAAAVPDRASGVSATARTTACFKDRCGSDNWDV